MKTKFLNIALASVLLAVTSVANAGIITLNNSTEIGAFQSPESFTALYSYVNSGSDNGFEQEATAVMFLAEFNGELALYTLLDEAKSFSGETHGPRSADLAISNFNAANVLLVDDSNEMTNTGFSWQWVDCCSDGMVYKIDDVNNFDIDLAFSNVVGLSKFTFLSFLGTETPSGNPIDVTPSFSIQSDTPVEVPEPSTLAIFALGLMGFAARKFKKTA